MTIRILQYNESCVTPSDDAELYKYIFSNESGVLEGCSVTKGIGNEIKVSAGKLIIEGRIIVLEDESIIANLSSNGKQKGRLILKVDTTKPLNDAVVLNTQVAEILPELEQENININGQIYEFELATYDCNTTDISNLTETSIKLENYNLKLSKKVDKVNGKSLSDENFTLNEKNKLNAIEEKANNYIHPDNHNAEIIIETNEKQFVSLEDKTLWNSKADENHTHSYEYKIIKDSCSYIAPFTGIYKIILTGAGQSGIQSRYNTYANAGDTVIDLLELKEGQTYNITIGKPNRHSFGNGSSFDNLLFASGGNALNAKSVVHSNDGIIFKGERGYYHSNGSYNNINKSGTSYWGACSWFKRDDKVIKDPISQPFDNEFIYFNASNKQVTFCDLNGNERTIGDPINNWKEENSSYTFSIASIIDCYKVDNQLYSMCSVYYDGYLGRMVFIKTDLTNNMHTIVGSTQTGNKYLGRYFYNPQYGGFIMYNYYGDKVSVEPYDIETNTFGTMVYDTNGSYYTSKGFDKSASFQYDKYIITTYKGTGSNITTSIYDMSQNKFLTTKKTHTFNYIDSQYSILIDNILYVVILARVNSGEQNKLQIYKTDITNDSQFEVFMSNNECEKAMIYNEKSFTSTSLKFVNYKDNKIYVIWQDQSTSYNVFGNSGYMQYCSIINILTKEIKVICIGVTHYNSAYGYGYSNIYSNFSDLIPTFGHNAGFGIDKSGNLTTKYLPKGFYGYENKPFGCGGSPWLYADAYQSAYKFNYETDLEDYSDGGSGVCVIEFLGGEKNADMGKSRKQ